MSIVFENQFGWFIDEKKYYDNCYQNAKMFFDFEFNYEINPNIYNIQYPFMFDSQFQKYIDNLKKSQVNTQIANNMPNQIYSESCTSGENKEPSNQKRVKHFY